MITDISCLVCRSRLEEPVTGGMLQAHERGERLLQTEGENVRMDNDEDAKEERHLCNGQECC